MSFMASFAIVNLEIFKLMFFFNYLTIGDIKDICEELIINNNEDNKNIMKIYVKDDFMEKEVERLLSEFFKERNINTAITKENLIILVLRAIDTGKVNFLDGIQFISDELVESSKSIEYFGDYLGLSDIIGIYYSFYEDYLSEKDKDELLVKGRDLVREYIEKNRKSHILS